MSSFLSVRGLTVAFTVDGDWVPIVRDLDMTVRRGEFVGLVGESGSGKTVTALSILGLLPSGVSVLKGSVELGGVTLNRTSSTPDCRLPGSKVAMVFQEPISALNPVLTLGYQICEAITDPGMSKKDRESEAARLLSLVGIPAAAERLRDYPHQLSGGQRQRMMIAMALAGQPDLLIADEPTSALDVTVQAQIVDLLDNLRSRLGLTILLITHDLALASEVCDRVMVMYAGQIVERAAVSSLFTSPAHPYTQGLIKAIPTTGELLIDGKLPVLPGRVAVPGDWPDGCAFQPRCSQALPNCTVSDPGLLPAGEEQEARCVLYEKGPAEKERG